LAQGPSQGLAQPPDQEDEDFADTEPVEGQVRLGVMVMSVTPELRRFFGVASDRGVLVARVDPGSAAARAGIQVGDVLVRVGPQVVHTGDDVVQALAARQGGRLRIAVVRQGRPVRLVAFVSTGANQNQLNNQNNPPINQNGQPINQNGSSNGSPQNQL
jgi:serine protease Do